MICISTEVTIVRGVYKLVVRATAFTIKRIRACSGVKLAWFHFSEKFSTGWLCFL